MKLALRNPTKAPKPIKHNPEKFKREVEQLSPSERTEVAEYWRAKAATIQNEMAASSENAIALAVGGGSSFALGYMSGVWDRRAEVEGFDLYGQADDPENKDDPRKLAGLPKTLLATVALGAAAVFGVGGKQNYMLQAAATGALATWAAEEGRKMGYVAEKKDPQEAQA